MSAELPLVSVMMPVFNGAKTLPLALESLLAQSYWNWECLLVDDCSTDSFGEVIQPFIRDKRIRLISLPVNRGRGNARQTALDYASGDYLTFLDCDDFFHPDKLAIQVRAMRSDRELCMVSVAVGSLNLKRELISVRGKGTGITRIYSGGNKQTVFFPASCLVITELAKKTGYNLNLSVAEDTDFFERYLSGRKYLMLPDLLYFYDEVGAVSYSKLLDYQFKKLVYDFLDWRKSPFRSTRIAFKTGFKLIVYAVLAPVVGVDFFLKKRGKKPTVQQLNSLKETLSVIEIETHSA